MTAISKSAPFFVLLFVASTSAFASQTTLKCISAEAEVEVAMTFTLENLGNPTTMKAVENGEEGNPQTPIFFQYRKVGATRWNTPKDPYTKVRAAALNGGDAGNFHMAKDSANRVILEKSASDDCVDAEIVLYKNMGYQAGYLRSQNNCDPAQKEKSYAKVVCSIQ
jgi:hypothetical protein